jgi:hypothetical protein
MGIIKAAYYAVLGITALIEGFYVLAMLFGDKSPSGRIKENIVVAVGLAVCAGFLYWAYRMGHEQGQWAAGIGLVAAGIVCCFVIIIVGMLTFGTPNWQ